MLGFPNWSAASKVAFRPTLVYVVIGVAWILVSDWFLEISVADPALLTRIQTYKGWFFVLSTAVVFFAVTRKSVAKELWLQAHLHRTEQLDALGKMASGTTHDFKNLLAIVSGSLELLDRSHLSDKDRRTLERIDQAILNGIQLSERLRSLATVPADGARVEDLSQIVRETLPLIRQAGMPVLTPRLELTDEPLLVFLDRTQLSHVLLNLTINARQATHEAGPLVIRTLSMDTSGTDPTPTQMPAGRFAVLQVQDAGSGMDESVLLRAKEAFFTTKGAEGTGLGLAQANSFARMYDGHLQIASRPGEGTRVSLYLPLMTSSESADGSSGGASGWSSRSRFDGKELSASRV